MAKAKKSSIVIRLVSMAGTGYFYTKRKNVKANPEKCAVFACTWHSATLLTPFLILEFPTYPKITALAGLFW